MTKDPHQPPAGPPGGTGAPPQGPPSAGRTPPAKAPGLLFFNRIRSFGIVRPDDGRLVAGVCAGLARRLGIDPLLVRGIFVVLAVVGGFGFGLYGLGWLLLPHPDDRIHAEGVLHGVVTAGFVGSVVLLVGDLAKSNRHHWDGSGWGPGFWLPGPLIPLAVIALVWWLIATRGGRGRGPAWPQPPGGMYPPVATPLAPRRLDLHAPSHPLTLAVLGLALVGAAATVMWDHLIDPLPTNTGLVAVAVALGIVALGVVVAGLLGRRAGGLAPTAVLLALISIVGAVGQGVDSPLTTPTWSPASADSAESGYTLGVGEATLDLTAPGLTAGRTSANPIDIPVQLGVGRIRIVVPDTTAVQIDASVGAGSLADDVNGNRTDSSDNDGGAGIKRVVHTHGDNPVIIVRTNVGLGSIEIEPQGQVVTP